LGQANFYDPSNGNIWSLLTLAILRASRPNEHQDAINQSIQNASMSQALDHQISIEDPNMASGGDELEV
jgi:hypothetical protein